jgi:RimJ/RimL family protein N-acetyltransferase
MRLDCDLCVVRDWRADDRESLVRFADNRNVWINLTHRFPSPYTERDADAWFAMLAGMPQPTHWAIEVDRAAVGGIGAIIGEGTYGKTADFGYWLGEPYWGRGIMTAAARVVSEYTLMHLGLVRLEARVFAWNPASMRVLEKSGFEREGLLRKSVFKDGQIIDSVLYGRVR